MAEQVVAANQVSITYTPLPALNIPPVPCHAPPELPRLGRGPLSKGPLAATRLSILHGILQKQSVVPLAKQLSDLYPCVSMSPVVLGSKELYRVASHIATLSDHKGYLCGYRFKEILDVLYGAAPRARSSL